MQIKCSKDVVSLSALKVNPRKIVNRARDVHRPLLLTSRGKAVAVVQGIAEYEADKETQVFMKAITQGLIDLQEGKKLELDTIKKRLGIS